MAFNSPRYFSISSEDRQSALDDAWEAAPEGAESLRQQLRDFEKAARSSISAGPLASSSSNGHSAAAMLPGEGDAAPVERARIWRELLNLYDAARRWLKNPPTESGAVPSAFAYEDRDGTLASVNLPVAVPDEIMIDAKMRDWLVPITECRGDYSQVFSGGPGWG